MIKLIYIFFILMIPTALAQSPGGVNTGASLWYRADIGTNCQANGCEINDWQAQIGDDASQPTQSLRPDFFSASAEFNFNPALQYSGSQRLAIENLNYTNQNLSHVYTWAVFRTTSSGGAFSSNWSFIDFDRSEFFNIYAQPDDGTIGWSFEADGIKDNSGTSVVNNGQVYIASGGYNRSLTNDTTIRVNGDLELETNRTATNLNLGDTPTRFGFIGDGSEASSFNGAANNIGFNGEIAEVILYTNQELSLSEIQQIESYLAIKYGITLSTNDGGVNGDYLSSTGATVWDASSGSFHNEVFGIARDDNGGLHQKQSKSVLAQTGLSVYHGAGYAGVFPSSNSSNANDLSDNQYLLMGHDNSDFSFSAAGLSPFGVDFCEDEMTRVYKVHDSGSVGVSTLVFNPATFTSLVSGTQYSIAVSNDSGFTSLASSASLVEHSSGVFYAEVDFPNSQVSYFRIVEGGVSAITPICYSFMNS